MSITRIKPGQWKIDGYSKIYKNKAECLAKEEELSRPKPAPKPKPTYKHWVKPKEEDAC